jgi:hypothetical protein
MKLKTSELTGPALDWAVAKCEGLVFQADAWYKPATKQLAAWRIPNYSPSSNWAQAGPIIERERINVDPAPDCAEWYAYYDNHGKWQGADKPLIAAMRCYVASQLGDEVDVPEELT